MTKSREPKFKSLKEERVFWQTHDAFKVLGDEGWEVIEAGTTQVRSFYIARVGKHGALVRVPRELLERIGAKPGKKIRARTDGNRLLLEVV